MIATLAYDSLGRRESLTRGNGTVTHYEHDPVSRLKELRLEFAGTARDLTLGFEYNYAGQIPSTTRSNDLYAWTQPPSGMWETWMCVATASCASISIVFHLATLRAVSAEKYSRPLSRACRAAHHVRLERSEP